MYRILLQKKGSTIVTVIIVTAVLIILGMIMIDMTIQGLASTKRNRHIDYTDYSIQSAVEKWFSIIQSDEYKNIGMSEQPLSATDEDSLKAFAKKIVGTTPDDGLLKKKLRERPDYVSDKGIPISVLPKSLTDPDSSYDSYVKINNIYLAKEVEADDFVSEPSGGVLTLTLGFVLDGYYRDEDTKFSTLIEDVFAQKEFAFNVPIDGKFKLEAAIYSVGDLYVSSDPEGPRSEAFYNDNFNPTITGDVNIFGTSAKNILVPSQYFYGGIYALCNSKLKINGNAYTRSFIRTGTYLGSRPESAGNNGRSDKSEIHITKDAVAQCIQGFGNDNKIVVYNNAYTFDDIELNGQNSVIAINGSYIGLTGGELSNSGGNWSYTISNNHDTSSAIVNSAPLHNMLNDKSLSSRIVINGDLLVAGSTFKIDPADGTMQGEIEDASLAWDKIANLPYYKIFDWNDSGSQYTIKLREQYRAPFNNIDSFLNLFQMWSIKSSDDIESWLGEIDAVRTAQTGTNDLDNATTDLAVPDKLSGFSKYQMAANGKLYCNTFSGDTTFDFKSNNNSPSGLVYDHITKANYRIENIYDSDGNTLKYNGPSVWQGINPEDGIGSVLLSDVRFKVVKDDLIAKTHQFAQRNYPTTDSVWYTSTQFDSFNGLLSKLKGKMTTTNTYKDNVNCLYINVGDFTSSVPLDLQSLDKTGPEIPKKVHDIYARCAKSQGKSYTEDTDYSLIVNEDPDLDIEISGAFNGILVSAGKVIIKDDASIRGSIIAAGGGEYEGPAASAVFYPTIRQVDSDNDVGSITGDTAEKLDKGEYAGVKIIATAANKKPKVDFFLGLNEAEVRANAKTIDDSIPDDTSQYYPVNKCARLNLLKKLAEKAIYVSDIF